MPKYIFIIFAIFLGLMVFPVQPVLAVENLVVEFSCGSSTCPIFGVVNFMPGGTATGWAKVTNNSGAAKKIAIEAIHKTDVDNLASKINLLIKEGDNVRYEKTLADFFSGGEVYLSDLANGVQTQYDLTATFNSDAGDSFQGKSLGFDIIIGFQGEEGTGGGGGGGGGGGALPPGLTISNDGFVNTAETSATMSWSTSYFSTGYIIYGTAAEKHTLDLSDTAGNPPKYGYEHATPEIDITPKATYHTVTITGLLPGTTYFYRDVSHGSLAISREYTFTTLPAVQTEQPIQQQQAGQQGTVAGASTENTSGGTGSNQQGQPTTENPSSAEVPATLTLPETQNGANPFLAGMGIFGSTLNSKIFIFLIIIAIIVLLVLFLPALRNLFKKKKGDKGTPVN